ncbi:MAG TPA: choice-of-anchor tandem repeat GloVer-containing protein [Bryocella sp.]|nr:choice-of-anchor tandem repeat GloVer-containing protein [Bryocella sp.]
MSRTVVLVAVTALLITSATLPTAAQNSVPASAVQAARTPQFAARLAHPAHSSTSPSNPALARQGSRNGPPQGGNYDNGPINGTTDAWTINSGFAVSDTIVVGGTSITGMTFGAWVFPGDVLLSVEISITSSEFGGTTYFDGVVNFVQNGCSTNQYGFNVCTETSVNFTNGPNLAGGTYWVNLQNAVVNNGDPVYWDENSGIGCESEGCPSLASDTSVGTIPSEAFTVLGNGQPTCFESEGSLQIISNLSQQQAGVIGEDGVTIDHAGNLYGAFPTGGNNSAGFAFKLAHFADWVLNPLFNFLGGSNAGDPAGIIVGPNGTLYGGAQGGIQNCGTGGSQDCGLVFNLTPPPTVCKTALCGWDETVAYSFTSESDGTGVINVSSSDQDGNLYGTTSAGGANDAGTVFELTPSGGGWTKTILYTFTGHNDGGTPTQVLAGNDGNLYGLAGSGVFHSGVVFQLTPSGGQWTESVLHAFTGTEVDGGGPGYLVQDNAGNLYGIATTPLPLVGLLFALQKAGSGWTFSTFRVQHSCTPSDFLNESLNNLTIDASGNLFGTGGATDNFPGSFGKTGSGPQQLCFYNYIFKASLDSNGWHYQDLDFLLDTYFGAGGGLAVDTGGNLYGTTLGCGTYNGGTVWERSP